MNVSGLKNKRIQAVVNAFWDYTSDYEKNNSPIAKAVNDILYLDINADEVRVVFNMFDKDLLGNILSLGFKDKTVDKLIYDFVDLNKQSILDKIDAFKERQSKLEKGFNLSLNPCGEVYLGNPQPCLISLKPKTIKDLIIDSIEIGSSSFELKKNESSEGGYDFSVRVDSGMIKIYTIDDETAESIAEYAYKDLSTMANRLFDKSKQQSANCFIKIDNISVKYNVDFKISSMPSIYMGEKPEDGYFYMSFVIKDVDF